MNQDEYSLMAEEEESHWWYQGLHDVLFQTLTGMDGGLTNRARVFDAGCGTGGSLAFLASRFELSYLGGIDISPRAIEIAASKVPTADLRIGDICESITPPKNLDLVICLDVVNIPGVTRSLTGLRDLVSAIRPGGLFVLNVPAYRWLYSEHDIAVHTTERYSVRKIRRIMEELGLDTVFLTYRLCPLFLPLVLFRLRSVIEPLPAQSDAQSDLYRKPSSGLSRLLFTILRTENWLISRGMRFPFGSSVYAVGRKC